ncbi:MAG TPA: ABC transporter permease [Candidatus Limnocylindria bacterium]|nr:ABC transporter permease [Candidatus Limnocylindria bacterium]
MSTRMGAISRRSGRLGRAVGRFFSGINAVSIKELRGRMRGRRAFVVVTVYLLLLSGFAFAIYQYLRQQAATTGQGNFGFAPDMGFFPGVVSNGGTALSASIGHGIFGGLLLVETLLVLVLAPAFTTGAISMEREKQTLDMLVTTPLSTLGMVIGKLFSALSYVFLLIVASIPLASLVFVFGGVGPEDLIRGYVLLFALAFGMGAIGLFISALVKRTQTATVITYVTVLVLAIGTVGLHQFLTVVTRPESSSRLVISQPHRAPEAILWLNPFVANLDLICTTNPGSYHESCVYISSVTRRPYFATTAPSIDFPARPQFEPGMPIDDFDVMPPQPQQLTGSLGFPRDTFWPKSAAAFVGVGLLLTLLATQLVAPTRRLRLLGPRAARPVQETVFEEAAE